MRGMKRLIQIVGVVWCLLVGLLSEMSAQIPQDGWPVDLSSEEKFQPQWYSTGGLKEIIDLKYALDGETENLLKPFRFAHGFEVALSPDNSGQWIGQSDKRIWILGIESSGAYSINFIFGKYHLPAGARLFIFSPDRSEVLGAFTSSNNSESFKLATLPVTGDKVIVQYEEPYDSEFYGELEISKIAHDFSGVTLKSKDLRRPMMGRMAEPCNVNINCEEGLPYPDSKNSVCRIFIDGTELCTGTLVNTTAHDGKPYLLTARHCIENSYQAQVSLFLFNYESPYCGSIDGDNTHSISGSTLKATFDSLDFSLVELSTPPPNYFRPYYAGWDVNGTAPASSYAVHHPVGDVKKIAIDKNAPVTASFNKDYLSLAFWKVLKWDLGVTEIGSSGGSLFDSQNRIVGTLTGGAANCSRPENDYYVKLSKSWSYRKENAKQLKYWLDPINTGEKRINGYQPYSGEKKCGAFTNFTASDTTQLIRIMPNTATAGYVSGTNSAGYTEFAERFSGLKSCNLHGVSLGIARRYIANSSHNAVINLKVYEGSSAPGNLLHSQDYSLSDLTAGAMNYLAFDKTISTTGDFFVSYSLQKLGQSDTLAVYQAKRTGLSNSFYLKKNETWSDYKTLRSSITGSSLLMELVACNIDNGNASYFIDQDSQLTLSAFPNPLQSGTILTVKFNEQLLSKDSLKIFNLLGAEVPFQVISENDREIRLQIRDSRPGIYLLDLISGSKKFSTKISVVP